MAQMWTPRVGIGKARLASDVQTSLSRADNAAPRLHVYVSDYAGYDPSGATSSDAAIQSALAALGSSPGSLVFGTGTFKYTTAIVLPVATQGIEGQGRGATFLRYVGSSGMGITHRPLAFASNTQGARHIGYTAEGYSASGTAGGIEIGDLVGLTMQDVRTRGWPGDGTVFRNADGWIEQSDISLMSGGNAGAQVRFDGGNNAAVTASFMYNKTHLRVYAPASADGVVLQNGASIFGGTFDMIFNAARGATNTGTVLKIGSSGESSSSGFINTGLRITGEANGTGTNHAPLVMAGSGVVRDSGVLWYQGSGWGAATLMDGAFSFAGRCCLGSTIRQNFGLGQQVLGGSGYRIMAGAAVQSGASLTINPDLGTNHRVVLSSGGNTLTWGGGVGSGESDGISYDLHLMLIQPSSGSEATVSWPGTVSWVTGVSPRMKITNNAVDHVRLVRLPNGTWYGWHLNPDEIIVSSGSRSLVADHTYMFAGSSATTWTLPPVANLAGRSVNLKNRGSVDVTVSRAGTDQIYSTTAATSVTLAQGAAMTLKNDGTYWVVM